MLHEEELLGGDLGGADEGSVMGNDGLEVSTEVLALDPVDHEAAETGTGKDTVLEVNVIEVIT